MLALLEQCEVAYVAERFNVTPEFLQSLPERMPTINLAKGVLYEYNAIEQPISHREYLLDKCLKREIIVHGKLLRRETLRKMLKPKPIHDVPPSERPRIQVDTSPAPKYRKYKNISESERQEIQNLKDTMSLHELMERFNLSARSINDVLFNRVRRGRKRKTT